MGTQDNHSAEKQRPTYLILKHKLSRYPLEPFCLACIPELSQLFWTPADVNTEPPRWLPEMPLGNTWPTSAPNKKHGNSRLLEFTAGTTHTKVKGKGPWDSNCSGARNNLLKKPIIRSHVWFSETSTILKKCVEPKCKWRMNTHTNQWANPTKMSTEIPRAEKWSPRGRGGAQEKGYKGSPLWWQTEAKLSAPQWILKSNYNPVHRKQFVKKKKMDIGLVERHSLKLLYYMWQKRVL